MPKKAPASIIPSRPMFTTPERSETTPPRARRSTGWRSAASRRRARTRRRRARGSSRPTRSARSRRSRTRTPPTIAPQPSRAAPRAPPTTPSPAAPAPSTSDGTGVRTSSGGSASQNANRPSPTAPQPDDAGRSTRARPSAAGERRGAHAPAPSPRRAAFAAAAACTAPVTITGAETSRTIRPWMISVRFVASWGGNTSGSRLRTDVPLMQRAEQQRREQHAAGGVAPEQRDRDADEAGADDARVLDVVGGDRELPAEDVDHAREPGERAADQHHLRVGPAGVDAAVLGGVGVEADGARLVARDRAVQQHPEHDQRGQRDEDPDVQALQLRVAPEHVQPRVPRRPRWRSGPTCPTRRPSAAGRRGRTPTRRSTARRS